MRTLRLLLALVCLSLLLSCTARTTRHLPHNAWNTDEVQTLRLRYVTFRYKTSSPADQSGTFLVAGELCPEAGRLPDWASWYGGGLLTVYGVSGDGAVLAEDAHILGVLPLDRNRCLPVDAALKATEAPLFITLGYRLTLADGEPARATRKTFIAEDALEQ